MVQIDTSDVIFSIWLILYTEDGIDVMIFIFDIKHKKFQLLDFSSLFSYIKSSGNITYLKILYN